MIKLSLRFSTGVLYSEVNVIMDVVIVSSRFSMLVTELLVVTDIVSSSKIVIIEVVRVSGVPGLTDFLSFETPGSSSFRM